MSGDKVTLIMDNARKLSAFTSWTNKSMLCCLNHTLHLSLTNLFPYLLALWFTEALKMKTDRKTKYWYAFAFCCRKTYEYVALE
jgi:hypothetical protein